MSALYLGAFRLMRDKLIHLRNGPIENAHFVPVIVHVKDQILAHHRQADQPDVTASFFHVSDDSTPHA